MGDQKTTIREFFAGRNIFITGATGFVGKMILYKLLSGCPEIGKVYILMRPKKGNSIQERFEQMLCDVLFDLLKKNYPGVIEQKLVPVEGDCMELGLGLSPENRQLLVDNVSVVYHVAASVRFDDALRDAIILNTRGTREIAKLALEIKNLAVLVHVSTTYCNCVVGHQIKEELYPAPTDWRQVIEVAEKFDPGQLAQLADKYLGPYPNTYTFTKALGEHVIADLCGGKVPTVIFRPSIVISSLEDPVEGWIDNFNGPVGLLVACGKGLMRCSYQEPDTAADFIPVDVTVKVLIVSSWDVALRRPAGGVEVVHGSSSGSHKWMTLGEVIRIGRDLSADIPLNDALWVPKGSVSRCRYKAYIYTVLFQLLPAFLLDLGLRVAGHRPLLARLQTKIYNAALQLRYFTFQEWDFKNDKLNHLEKLIPETDRTTWGFEFRHRDGFNYLATSILGARRYLLKESDDTLEKAKRHYKRMYWLDKVAMFFYYSGLCYIAYQCQVIERAAGLMTRWTEQLFSMEGV